jgi:hypothetical protein
MIVQVRLRFVVMEHVAMLPIIKELVPIMEEWSNFIDEIWI